MVLDSVQTRRVLHQLIAIEKLADGWDTFSSWVRGIRGHSAYKMYAFTNSAGIIYTGKEIQVVFQGTNDLFDLMVDMKLKQNVTPYGHIHSGFYAAWRGYESQLSYYLDKIDPDKLLPVSVTGHSLGGALAMLAGNYLSRTGRLVLPSYVFGSPLVGDRTWVESCKASGVKITRIVNDQDIITRLPFFFNYYPEFPSAYLSPKGRLLDKRPFAPLSALISVFCKDHGVGEYIRKMNRYQDRLP